MTIRIGISLPYSWSGARKLPHLPFYRGGRIGRHKAWEVQLDYFGWNNVFDLGLDLIPMGSDHAGLGVSLTLLGFMIEARIYDSRHWNDDTGQWQNHD